MFRLHFRPLPHWALRVQRLPAPAGWREWWELDKNLKLFQGTFKGISAHVFRRRANEGVASNGIRLFACCSFLKHSLCYAYNRHNVVSNGIRLFACCSFLKHSRCYAYNSRSLWLEMLEYSVNILLCTMSVGELTIIVLAGPAGPVACRRMRWNTILCQLDFVSEQSIHSTITKINSLLLNFFLMTHVPLLLHR